VSTSRCRCWSWPARVVAKEAGSRREDRLGVVRVVIDLNAFVVGNAALDGPLNLRIDEDLDARLKQQAAAEQIPTSALVRRRLLRWAVGDIATSALKVEQVEAVARRVVAQSPNA
jgi:hypothetical protein